MIAAGAILKRGQAQRDALEQALLRAGPAGTRPCDLAAAVGITDTMVSWYLARVGFAYRAPARILARRLVFHVRWRAEADAYAEKVNAIPKRGNGPSEGLINAARQALQASGKSGLMLAEIAAAIGSAPASVLQALTALRRAGDVARSRAKTGARRYFITGFEPASQRAPSVGKANGRASSRPPVNSSWMPHRRAPASPGSSVAEGLHGLTLKPGAKVTVIKHQGAAPASASAQNVFGAMRLGQYLDNDSAIARAYAHSSTNGART